eukprot:6475045-Amphidinium_carterae.1
MQIHTRRSVKSGGWKPILAPLTLPSRTNVLKILHGFPTANARNQDACNCKQHHDRGVAQNPIVAFRLVSSFIPSEMLIPLAPFAVLLGLKQSFYRVEFLATARALEECQPARLVSDCKGVAD